MIKNRFRKKSALLLAAVLSISAFAITDAYAAVGVDVEEECSLQIDVPASGFSELPGLDIPVNIYKVADIAVTGKYPGQEAFAGKRVELTDEDGNVIATVDMDDLGTVSSETTAEEWLNLAAAAKKVIDESSVSTAATATISGGTATVSGLEVGLYLIDAQSKESQIYRYHFQPYLISLPNNYYYSSGDDTWIYDLTGTNAVGLKPEKEDLLGYLQIDKTVDVFNGTYDKATFVFQVEAVKADPDAPEGTEAQKVFSDVFAMEFTGPGSKSLIVGPIPAGADVTVTEVYTGASYSTTQDTQTTVIIADEVLADNPELSMATVGFTNTHDDRPNGGNGIVNTFSYDNGQWTYQAAPESSSVVMGEQ